MDRDVFIMDCWGGRDHVPVYAVVDRILADFPE